MEQTDLLAHAVAVLDRLGVTYMLVGSYASYAYGEPRLTQDIDIVADFRPADVAPLCAAFPPPDFYVSEPAVREAVRTRFQFNVLHTTSGSKIDFVLPRADDWGRTQLSRRRPAELLPGTKVSVASPEDVIVGKLWYYADGGSEKHLRDIAGILRVSGDAVDRAEVGRWAAALG